MSAVQAAVCTMACAAILLASSCTAYGSMLPESMVADVADKASAEGDWHQGGQHVRRLTQGTSASTSPVVGGVGSSSTSGTPTTSAGAAAANDTSAQAQTAGTGSSGGAGSSPIVGAATPGVTDAPTPSTAANVTGQPANTTDSSSDQGVQRRWGSSAAMLGVAAGAAAVAGALW